MMRYLGNTFAKSCRKGRLQYRDFSSSSEKVVTKIVEYCFKGAFCAGGYLLGGLTTSPISKDVQESEEMCIDKLKFLEEKEANLEKLMKNQLTNYQI